MNKDKNKSPFKKLLFICLILVLLITSVLAYSKYIGTTGLDIKEYKIQNKALSKDFYGMKIVHFSDIHYGRTIHKKELQNLIDKINLVKPDIVFFTGDLIDKDYKITKKEVKNITSILSNINTSIKKYYIKGNHDYKYSEFDQIMSASGFIDLNDSYDFIYANEKDYLFIGGMSTNSYGKLKPDEKISTLNNIINQKEIKPNYSILIMHEPDFIDKFDFNNFNLIMAGHSHNGQIRLPFIGAIIKPKNAKNYYDEYYKINKTKMYISSGIGVSEVNFRLFNHPSFNLYRLTN